MIEGGALFRPDTRMRRVKSIGQHGFLAKGTTAILLTPQRFKQVAVWNGVALAQSMSGNCHPRRAHAAITVFRNKQAIVIGPTPPGTGVIEPATDAQLL